MLAVPAARHSPVPAVTAGEVCLKGTLAAVDSQGLLLLGSSLKQEAWKVHSLAFLAPSTVKYQKETSLGCIFHGWGETGRVFFPEVFFPFSVSSIIPLSL